LLLSSGQIMACGYNKSGQCGINSSTIEIVPNFRPSIFSGDTTTTTTTTPTIVQVACGEDFSVAVSMDGYLYSTGSSEYGQLGNGATGEYFVAANKLAFANATTFTKRTTFCYAPQEKIYSSGDTSTKVIPLLSEDIRIQQIACGKHHTIALEADVMMPDDASAVGVPSPPPPQPRIFTWGCGNYGVLGHGVQADEYYPRNVGALGNLHYMTASSASVSHVMIAAGQHCSLLQTSQGHVYYWGKHRSVGEATMRPTLVDALANNQHVVTQIGAGGQTVVCCTKHAQTVAWGQGMYGELGLGSDKKSSAKPAFVPGLEGCHVMSLACGYGTTLFVVRDTEEEDDRAILDKLPILDPSVPESLAEAHAESVSAKAISGKKGKSKK
jgi:alpha-tubulin suppressor-like RCC1 family protein